MSVRHFGPAVALLCAAACGGGGDTDVGASARVPAATELVGSYDIGTTPPGASAGVATVFVHDRVHEDVLDELFLNLNAPAVSLHGALHADGTLPLEGMTTGSDAVLRIHGEARAEQRDATLRIAGTLNTGMTFVMERPLDADQSRASGRYRLRLSPSPQPDHGDGTIELELRVQPNGVATADGNGAERDAAGTPIGTVSNLSAVVAPSGRFTLTMQYDFVPGGACLFGQHCRLDVGGVLPRAADDDLVTDGGYSYAVEPTLFGISGGDVEITRLGALPRVTVTVP
jgi:hypothetical protein